MSLLQEIRDTGATTAWCPVRGGKTTIAVGTKDGAGGGGQTFEDYGGELALFELDLNKDGAQPKQVAKTEASTRFSCLAWGSKGPSGAGIIAGGMQNGAINVWDPKVLTKPLATISKHKSKVNSLQFNPHSATGHLLATGASDNEVYIVDLNKPGTPNVYSPAGPDSRKHTSEVRTVAWNTEVVHVLATGSLDGSCTVWSLKAKKPWAEIRDPNGAGFSAVAWNPAQGLHLLTATNDDRDPVLRLWDVRSSTTNPLAEFRGHTSGIFSVSWCPADPSFAISCGKDNKTIFWDLYANRPVVEIYEGGREPPPAAGNGHIAGHGGFGAGGMADAMGGAAAAFGGGGGAGSQANNMFGGSGGMSGGTAGRRYQVEFSPTERCVFSTCSFDRKVQIFSVDGVAGGVGAAERALAAPHPSPLRAPSWTKRKAGATFGFGGHLVSFGSAAPSEQGQHDFAKGPRPGAVRLTKVLDDKEFQQCCVDWDNELSTALASDQQHQHELMQQGVPDAQVNTALIALCARKAQAAKTEADRTAWEFLSVLFEPNARDKVVERLGFDLGEINELVASMDKRAQISSDQDPAAAQAADHQYAGYAQGYDPTQQMHQGQGEQYDPSQQQQQHFDGSYNPQNQGYGQFGQQGQPQVNGQDQYGANGAVPANNVFDAMNGGGSALDAFNDEPANASGEEENVADTTEEAAEGGEAPAEDSAAEASSGQASPAPPGSLEPSVTEAPTEPSPAVPEPKQRTLSDVDLDDVEVKDSSVDDIIRKALMVGNVAVAVDSCFENNRFADALLLARCGNDDDLWNETVEKYLNRFYEKKPYTPVLTAIFKDDLTTFIQRANLADGGWKEVLAIVSRYGQSSEVPVLCDLLGSRLESEIGDEAAMIGACICHIFAKNVQKTVAILIKQGLDQAQSAPGGRLALSQSIVEKSTVFQHALAAEDQAAMMSIPEVMEHFITMAEALAGQGMLEYAAKCLSSVDMTVYNGELQQEFDPMGNLLNQTVVLTEFEQAHNEQAYRARLLADRVFLAHPDPNGQIIQFLPNLEQPFEIQQINVAPSNTPIVLNAQGQQQQHQMQMHQGLQGSPRLNPNAGQPHPQPPLQSQPHPQQQQQQLQGQFGGFQPQQQQPHHGVVPNSGSDFGHQVAGNSYGSRFHHQQQQQQQQPPQPNPSYGNAAPYNTMAPPGTAGSYQAAPQLAPQPLQQQQQQQPGMMSAGSFAHVPPAGGPQQLRQRTHTNSNTFVKENDGFGSTAGNPEAGSKYGNMHPGQQAAAAQGFGQQPTQQPSVWNTQQQQQPHQQPHQQPLQQQQQQAPAQRGMPPSMAPVMQVLAQHMQQLKARMTSSMQKHKFSQAEKMAEVLKEKLMTGQIPEAMFAEITEMVHAVQARDFDTALRVRSNLNERYQAEHGDWLKGTSALILLSKN